MLNGSELDLGNGLGATAAGFTVEQAVKKTTAQHKTSQNHLVSIPVSACRAYGDISVERRGDTIVIND
jgi:hypothetical protein